jgi:hypothetical protein
VDWFLLLALADRNLTVLAKPGPVGSCLQGQTGCPRSTNLLFADAKQWTSVDATSRPVSPAFNSRVRSIPLQALWIKVKFPFALLCQENLEI